MRKSLVRQRTLAYNLQGGCCFYCSFPMWCSYPTGFIAKYGFKPKHAARFQCTGEHLIARKDGGTESCSNIAAACRFCNVQRHRRKAKPTVEEYREYVQKRLAKGAWHPSWMVEKICETK